MKLHLTATTAAAVVLLAAAGSAAEPRRSASPTRTLRFPMSPRSRRRRRTPARRSASNCIEADAVNDTNKELSNVESMLAKGIDCLAFEAASLDASVASIDAANKKGVPVVQFNGKASGGDYVTFVGSAQTDSGVKLGQFLEGLYKKLGKDKLKGIYLRGVAGQVTDIARNDGMKNYLNSRPASATRSSSSSSTPTTIAARASRSPRACSPRTRTMTSSSPTTTT